MRGTASSSTSATSLPGQFPSLSTWYTPVFFGTDNACVRIQDTPPGPHRDNGADPLRGLPVKTAPRAQGADQHASVGGRAVSAQAQNPLRILVLTVASCADVIPPSWNSSSLALTAAAECEHSLLKMTCHVPDLAPTPTPTPTLWPGMLDVAVAVAGCRIVASYCVVRYCLCASTLVYNSIPFPAYLPGPLYPRTSESEENAQLKSRCNLTRTKCSLIAADNSKRRIYVTTVVLVCLDNVSLAIAYMH